MKKNFAGGNREMIDCRGCLRKFCEERANCHEKMKSCMQSETYEKCKIDICRACSVRMACDRETWIALGGVP